MPYKVTYLSTKPNSSVPDFKDWIKTLPQSTLDPFPSLSGVTPYEIMQDVKQSTESTQGFISKTSTNESDGLTLRTEFVWQTEDDYRAAEAVGNLETPSKYLRNLYENTFNIQIQKIEESI
jgi:hypothetical protein